MSNSSTSSLRSETRVVISLATVFALRMFGLFMLLPVFSVLGTELEGATPVLVGSAIGVYGLMQALFQLPFGVLSDRVGRKPLILFGLLVFALGGAVAACSESIYGVILGRAMQGAGAIASVIMALLADLISEQHRTRAMAVVGMSIGGSFVLAMILGPFLASWLGGLAPLFWLTSALACAAFLVTLLWVPKAQVKVREGLAFRERFFRVLSHPGLMRLNAGIFTLHLVMTAMFVVLPLELSDQLGLSIASHGWLYLLTMLLGVLGMVPLMIASERRAGTVRIMLVGILLLLVAQLMLSSGRISLWWLGGALWVFFTGFNLLEALLPSQVGRAAPAGTKGTSMGVYSSSQFLGVFVGAQLGGVILQWQGAQAVFLMLAGFVVVWGGLTLTLKELPRLDNRVVELTFGGHSQAVWTDNLLSVPGVIEAVVLSEEKVAMLKVDPRYLDQSKLDQVVNVGATLD